eukprot:CAMPEP_0195114242 /NCGR_PEP_ID=MMETSP0448-20130528/105410_1 /TAXON_ID=66468 /ORGANISM="Heterocapsa triquestra, Strain CCMP 448" /LENGTH=50 /DNA_ID=CAMNT_0040151267 /DNA_START=85 /DNA_END=233 /DNA_ORIENTATION=-
MVKLLLMSAVQFSGFSEYMACVRPMKPSRVTVDAGISPRANLVIGRTSLA